MIKLEFNNYKLPLNRKTRKKKRWASYAKFLGEGSRLGQIDNSFLFSSNSSPWKRFRAKFSLSTDPHNHFPKLWSQPYPTTSIISAQKRLSFLSLALHFFKTLVTMLTTRLRLLGTIDQARPPGFVSFHLLTTIRNPGHYLTTLLYFSAAVTSNFCTARNIKPEYHGWYKNSTVVAWSSRTAPQTLCLTADYQSERESKTAASFLFLLLCLCFPLLQKDAFFQLPL